MASESGRLSRPRDRELATRRRSQTRCLLTCVIVNLSDDAFQIRFHWPKVKCLSFFFPLSLSFEISVKIKIIEKRSRITQRLTLDSFYDGIKQKRRIRNFEASFDEFWVSFVTLSRTFNPTITMNSRRQIEI